MVKETLLISIFFCIVATNALAQKNRQKIDSIYRVRNFVIQELFSFGFEVDHSNDRTTILSNEDGPGDYFYQVAITVKRRRLKIDGYAFLNSNIRPSWVAKPWYGKKKIYEPIYSGIQWSRGINMPILYLWNWDRVKPRQ